MNDETPETAGGQVAVYEDARGEVRVDVRLDRETVWLTQRQMAEVFDSTPENVLMHLRNIFASGELEVEATTKEFLAVRTEGRRRVRRRLKHYNLDAIISVGYRVNTRHGVRFRQWATRTLHGHLVRGFTLNERRLAERGLQEARETLDLLARTLSNQALVDDTGQAVLDLIAGYANTWRRRLEYDEDRLSAPGRPALVSGDCPNLPIVQDMVMRPHGSSRRPWVDYHDTGSFEIPDVVRRDGHAAGSGNGRNLAVRRGDRTTGEAPVRRDICTSACGGAVERQDPFREAGVEPSVHDGLKLVPPHNRDAVEQFSLAYGGEVQLFRVLTGNPRRNGGGR